MKIGAVKLSEYLAEKNIRPSYFAAVIGVYPSTITRWLVGYNCPDIELAMSIEKETEGYVKVSDWAEIHIPKKKLAKVK